MKALRDGRTPLLFAAAVLGGLMALLSGAERLLMWRQLGVLPLDRSFGDLRVVTSAWDCSRRGIDVLAANPCDPWSRAMNYPRIWLLPGAFGLGQSSTVIIGIALCAVFLLAVMILLGRLSQRQAVLYGVMLGSPAVLLAVERGNTDLLGFALCALGLVALHRAGTSWTAVGVALILAATVLKLYPVFALAVLVPRTRIAVAALVVAAGYAVLTRGDLSLISQATPRPIFLSYGTGPVAAGIGLAPIIVAVGIVLASGIIALVPKIRQMARETSPSLAGDAFVAGAALFFGTFLIGSNWDYRLTMLLLCAPRLVEWMRSPSTRSVAAGALAGVVALLWLTRFADSAGPGTDLFRLVSVGVVVVLAGLMASILWNRVATSWLRAVLPGRWRPAAADSIEA